MEKFSISLIIPAYNEEEYIGSCLDAALASSRGRFCEIIVVDNGSSDRTREIAAAKPGVRVILEERRGNQGFGYDPIFYLQSLGKTYAELDFETVCQIGFRAIAARELFFKVAELPNPS